jgi:protein tyrosine phosphatase domain-containing protein 1
MTAPTISLTQNIVRVGMAELLEGGKVAIHCHAGFGRTGIVVACLAMARNGYPADEAVQLVRTKR